MAGEDAASQSEDDVLSGALETFERGMGNTGMPGEMSAAGPQGSGTGAAGAGGGTGGPAGGGQSGSQPAAGAGTGTGGRETTSAERTGTGGGYRTDAERVAELDRQLEGQMGTFDGMLLEERAQVIAAGQTGDDVGGEDDPYGAGAGGQDDGGSGSGSAGDFGAGSEQGDGAPPLLTRGGAGGGGGMPDVKGGGGRRGDYEQVAVATPVPQDIPGADGDDVVARQLREAAMREPDPVLREKLWNEYRRYKGLPVKE